jgi:hypothetical protein
MAKDKGFNKPIRNRGEDIGKPRSRIPYDYQPADQYSDKSQERALRRHEVRAIYDLVYRDEQERDQRSFERVRDINGEFYAGLDPRRRQEIADGGMIREDQNQMANCPRMAMHHEYPQTPYYKTPYVDDLVRGIDNEIDDNGSSMKRYLNPNKSYTE